MIRNLWTGLVHHFRYGRDVTDPFADEARRELDVQTDYLIERFGDRAITYNPFTGHLTYGGIDMPGDHRIKAAAWGMNDLLADLEPGVVWNGRVVLEWEGPLTRRLDAIVLRPGGSSSSL